MANGLITLLALLVVGCSGGDDGSPLDGVERRCVRLRDHLIDMRLDSVAPDGRPHADNIRAQHRAALAVALGDDFLDRCAHTMSIEQIDCATTATDRDTANACSSN